MLDERAGGGRDHQGSGRWGPDRPTVVYVGTVAIGLTVFELREKTEMRYVDGEYVPVRQIPAERRARTYAAHRQTTERDVPSGKVAVREGSSYGLVNWDQQRREARRGELTSMGPIMVTDLEAAAVTVAQLGEEGEQRAAEERRRWEEQQERCRQEEAERRRVQNLEASREELTVIIGDWHPATQAERFFADAERRADTLEYAERAALIDRLRHAGDLLGGVNALQRFLEWTAPDER